MDIKLFSQKNIKIIEIFILLLVYFLKQCPESFFFKFLIFLLFNKHS